MPHHMRRIASPLFATATLLAVTTGTAHTAEAAPVRPPASVASAKIERTGLLVEIPGNPRATGSARQRSFQLQLPNGTLIGLDRVPDAKAHELAGTTVRVWGRDKAGRIDVGAGGLAPATTVADTAAPTAPTRARATVARAGLVKLTWTASTDDVGVASYTVTRGAKSWDVSTAATTDKPGKGTWSYTISARDAAGNVSSTATVTAVVR